MERRQNCIWSNGRPNNRFIQHLRIRVAFVTILCPALGGRERTKVQRLRPFFDSNPAKKETHSPKDISRILRLTKLPWGRVLVEIKSCINAVSHSFYDYSWPYLTANNRKLWDRGRKKVATCFASLKRALKDS